MDKNNEINNNHWSLGQILERINEPNVDGGVFGNLENRLRCYDIALKNNILSLGEVRTLEKLPVKPEV